VWPVLVLAALPWSWMLLRGLGGRLEAVAVALPAIVALALVVVIAAATVLRRRDVLVVAVSLAVFAAVTILAPRLPQTGPSPVPAVTVLAANVFSENPRPASAVTTLLAADADVEVAVETSPEFRDLIEQADGAHPYSAVDDQLVIRSRYPVTTLADPAGMPARRILRVGVDAPGAPFVLYAVHALNPLSESTFANQLGWVDRLRTSALRESMPVVLAGDFNMTDRQLGYRRMAGDLRDAVVSAGWGHTTYPHGIWAPLLMRIDHVFVTPTWCSARSSVLDVPGSDHDGVRVDVGPCP
jgi:endonuclease/exonuclease/phosphatase (EEP) superfamily protein YafD